MRAANTYTDDVLARLEEYCSLGAQWQRTLWSVGPAFALRELIESADGVQNGALSAKAAKRHAESVARMLGDDPAAGEKEPRRQLLALLTRDLSAGGANYHELRLWLAMSSSTLRPMGDAVTSPDKPSREQFARAIACELFRHGFSRRSACSRGSLRCAPSRTRSPSRTCSAKPRRSSLPARRTTRSC